MGPTNDCEVQRPGGSKRQDHRLLGSGGQNRRNPREEGGGDRKGTAPGGHSQVTDFYFMKTGSIEGF